MKKSNQEEVKECLRAFLPKFGEEHILYGATKVFFKDTAYTVLMKKYNDYLK